MIDSTTKHKSLSEVHAIIHTEGKKGFAEKGICFFRAGIPGECGLQMYRAYMVGFCSYIVHCCSLLPFFLARISSEFIVPLLSDGVMYKSVPFSLIK